MVTCIIIVKIMASTGLKKIMSVVELEESGDACGIYTCFFGDSTISIISRYASVFTF